ncbi:MAG: peptidylprolyl isomerase [Nitrosopumilus sp.]|uniref:peptidylprolyl isomerase n=1 Tax=Nitrosopumilus sp. TaxID=2024843 RepID=UPI00246BD2A9|nr:peptidylprolyl isomerase [Nitrosopumilus sp.]MDH5430553.1 peptidylprolyl isomerase [Nitrosopumilus sp.]MDH5697549.1 peptidylprolyl isomerase [Nitrosopumilus sp.]
MNKIFLILTISLLLVSFGNYTFAQENEINKINFVDPVVVLETNLGNITIEFFYNDAPKHVENFIKLSQSGFYDGTLFHRIIPGFMIQGGDPNTIEGDPSTWGTGGPKTSVDAEFNTIKHNRGIVSMARSADPNSGGSQFFIVHADSNFLDEQYTVFGRIITEESFETLDKIASVETTQDRPQDPEQVRITKVTIVNRSEVSNILELQEPERTESTITPSTGNQKYESTEHEIGFSVPEGWLLQTPNKTTPNSPDVVAVGPKIGAINPVISLTVEETNQRTMDDLIFNKTETIKQVVEAGNLDIISQEKISVNGNQAYAINAIGTFFSNNESFDVKFREIMIFDTEKVYTFAYSNGVNEFDSQLPRFEETIDSFEILSQNKEGGGCLIATATYGSELAPQVQQLREIRDNLILSTKSGTAFMSGFNQFYYSFSPMIADLERENPLFKEAVKITLTPLLTSLSILNYVDVNSEESVLGYGISLIILNIGMYFIAPTIIIYKIRK